jgi:hypothetical protein
MTADPEVLRQLARDSAERLTELGVRAGDSRWIRTHAETIASLAGRRRRIGFFDYLSRLARRAARTAR